MSRREVALWRIYLLSRLGDVHELGQVIADASKLPPTNDYALKFQFPRKRGKGNPASVCCDKVRLV